MPKTAKKIKTLIFHPALAPYRVDLFNALAELLSVKVVFLRENLLCQQFDQKKLQESLTCDYDYLLSGFDIKSRAFRWGIYKKISQFEPDVIICSEFSPITLWLSFIKLITSHNNWKLSVWTDDNVHIISKASRSRLFIINNVLRVASSVIVCSNDFKSLYKERFAFPKQAIGVCPIIRTESNYRRVLNNLLPLAQRLFNELSLSGKRIALFVGRLVKIKGVDRLLKAYSEAIRDVSGSLLVIVGDGPEKSNLEKLAWSYGIAKHVRFEGRFEGADLLVRYLLGDLFVLPSNQERYGAVVNEALMAGMPVLCSNRAGASDLICEGKNGYIFDPYDITELSRLMIKTLKNIPQRNDKICLRQSLMPISFNESVQGFVQAVNYAFTTPN